MKATLTSLASLNMQGLVGIKDSGVPSRGIAYKRGQWFGHIALAQKESAPSSIGYPASFPIDAFFVSVLNLTLCMRPSPTLLIFLGKSSKMKQGQTGKERAFRNHRPTGRRHVRGLRKILTTKFAVMATRRLLRHPAEGASRSPPSPLGLGVTRFTSNVQQVDRTCEAICKHLICTCNV